MSTPTNFQPQVAVIVPIYNGEHDLPELIDCLKKQTYPKDQVDYLLVDNNSSDRTATIIQDYATKLAVEGLNIRPLSSSKIQSSYAARNTGIKATQAEILAFTDADCRPQADWLNFLIQPLVNPQIGIVAGEILALPGKTWWEKYADYQEVLSQKHTLAHSFCPYGQTANLAIRRQALTQVGLFRPQMTTGGDADLCWRILRETDWQIQFAPQGIIHHRHRSTLAELRSQWRRYGRSNRYLHELYGVPLQRELTTRESVYRLTRWLAKELPSKMVQVMSGQSNPIELIITPLDLIGVQARSRGQQETRLSQAATEMEWL